MKEQTKQIILTIIVAALLVVLAAWLLPMVPGLPVVIITIVMIAIILLAVWHILTVLGWW